MLISTSFRKIKQSLASRLGRVLALAAYFAAFWAAFVILTPRFGPFISIFGIIPPLFGAWYYGPWLGLLFVYLVYALSISITVLMGWEASWVTFWVDSVLSLIISSIASLVVAKLGNLQRQYHEQLVHNQALLAERRVQANFLTLLNDILQAAMQTNSMQSLLSMLARRMGELFNADDCYITFWNEEKENLIPMVAYGDLSEIYPNVHQFKPDERSLTAAVLEAGHALAIEDIKHSKHLSPDLAQEFPNLSALGLPLISDDRKIGAIILGYDQIHRFGRDEVERGAMAARQISLVLAKSMLLEEARQRVLELGGLHAISQIFSLHGNAQRTYGLLTETLARITGAKICFIGLYEAETGVILPQANGYGIADGELAVFHHSAGMGESAGVFSTNQEYYLANTMEDLPAEFASLAQFFRLECLLAVPLWDVDKALYGSLFLANKPGGFNDVDIHLLDVFASQILVVIQNTHLLSSERKRTEQLAALQAVATATTEADDEDQLIERVTRIIGERLYSDSLGVLLLDAEQKELHLHPSYRIGPLEGLKRIPLGTGIPGMVAASGTQCRLGEVSSASGQQCLFPQTRSVLCIPLKVEEELLGVVNAESMKANAFSQEDEEFLDIIASQMATGIQWLRADQAERYQTRQLERSNSLIRALAQMNTRASAASDPDGVMQILGGELAKLGLRCLAALADASRQHMVLRYINLPEKTIRSIEHLGVTNLLNSSIRMEQLSLFSTSVLEACIVKDPLGLMMKIMPDFSERAIRKILEMAGITGTSSVCYLPLVAEGRPVGILWMWGEGLHESDLPTISLFASQAAVSLQNVGLLAEVQELARTDYLTGILNRRHFFELAEKEYVRSRRYKHPLSALIVDIDLFKQFNDRYGHAIGDQVLREVSGRMRSSLRTDDILGRHGGDEFSILLPETDARAAQSIAKRMVTQVADDPIPTEAGMLTLHVSIGVAADNPQTNSLHDLVNRADQAMYKAKEAGRRIAW